MAHLSSIAMDMSVTRQKAFEDAKKMQIVVAEECSKAGQEVPPYLLRELIGKGSFGRVYKASAAKSNRIVAVKIIDIEESDTLNPKLADTYSEFLKEVSALKLLSEGGAKNINHVLDALPVGQSMWMVCEYCAGGSVATLMKPTAPGGLQEKWIIPILREVAEAIFWVHKAGIIHRDIKCANVLITEAGAVQLCDFGVSGVVETRFDKRSTFIGTPHWMAPELFDTSASYGVEVDIWAFGSMVFEIASGLPPNVMAGIDVTQLGSYLKQHTPALQGDRYSDQLKDLVSFCLVEDPTKRPIIEEVQHHPYLLNTENTHPTSSLAMLVKAFRVWESQGGSRKSLFALGGAQGPMDLDLASTALAADEWNFSTTADFDQRVMANPDAQDVYDVYGSQVDLSEMGEPTLQRLKPKRRRPPPSLPVLRAPLEKIFDPNTISNYDENTRMYYSRPTIPPPPSDLPLRDNSKNATLRESLIDLDASLHGGRLSKFVDLETMKPGPRQSLDYSFGSDGFARPPNSDPENIFAPDSRKTQEWKFPVMMPASADPGMSRFPFNQDDNIDTNGFAAPSSRPSMHHHHTIEPLTSTPNSSNDSLTVLRSSLEFDKRVSMSSLIDLDESLPDPSMLPELRRPSIANSEATSEAGSAFDLDQHHSYLTMPLSNREPSIYVCDDSDLA
ncbi:kinase-like domain-containing protein, partial [Coniella lustricola]